MCSCLYLTYSVQPINLINFSSCYVKTNIFRVINFYFRLSTASRYVYFWPIYGPDHRRTKPKTKVDDTKNVRLDIRSRESWLGWLTSVIGWSGEVFVHFPAKNPHEMRYPVSVIDFITIFCPAQMKLMCSCLYLIYSIQTINLINFSGSYVKTNVFRFINFCFRVSTASRYVYHY